LKSGRTIQCTLSRRPRLLDLTQLPEALGLDHAQERFHLTADNQRRRQRIEPGGRPPDVPPG
jgi:hypothetical protein